jgi:hypothetical protein
MVPFSTYGMLALTPEKALIFRIVHIDNLPRIVDQGLVCPNATMSDPLYRNIGDPELMTKRSMHTVPIAPGGFLSDYVPFYFTPKSPMLLNIKTGRGVPAVAMRDIVILVASLRNLGEQGHRFLITDRHAYLQMARFSDRLEDLSWLPWEDLQNHDFKGDPNRPDKKERYQAEALIPTWQIAYRELKLFINRSSSFNDSIYPR